MPLVNIYPVDLQGTQYEQTYTSLTVGGFPGFNPGDCSYDNQGGKWMFVKANATINQYDLVTVSTAAIPLIVQATATLLTTTASGGVGIAQVAIPNGSFGWVWMGNGGGVGRGIKVTAVSTATLATKLYGTATAGQISSSVTAPLLQNLQVVATGTGALEVVAFGFITVNAQD